MDPQTEKGALFLFPATLGDVSAETCLPAGNILILNLINVFVVEEIRTARRFLKKAGYTGLIDDITFFLLNEHTSDQEIDAYLEPAAGGKNIGLMSEAGLPCVADPGHKLVSLAHQKGIRVIPLTGPSSLMLALMASGFSGQHFTFHGYLPVKTPERIKSLKLIEREVRQTGSPQLFIETPYRNMAMFHTIIETCHPDTRLCIAANITLQDEFIHTMPVHRWKSQIPELQKKPAVFILGI